MKSGLNHIFLAFTILIMLSITSCIKEFQNDENGNTSNDIILNTGFTFTTSTDIEITLLTENISGEIMPGVYVELVIKNPLEVTPDGKELFHNYEENIIAKGISSDEGSITFMFSLPTHIDEVYTRIKHIGFHAGYRIPITNEKSIINLSLADPLVAKTTAPSLKSTLFPEMKLLGTWKGDGKPDYLEKQRDKFSKKFMEDITASLPESESLTRTNPNYLDKRNKVNLDLNSESEVWITFVHEGAGWKNSMGYFTYPTDNPPETADDIHNKTIIFPNVSYNNSGGDLKSGDKVKIKYWDKDTEAFKDTFPANTTIGWFLIVNGWYGKEDYIHYSLSSFNAEANDELKQHTVMLYDEEHEGLFIGFEDMPRDDPHADHDFNDVVLFATVNDIASIDIYNVQEVGKPIDTDMDGVNDIFDEYPVDKIKAFNNYFPGENSFATLAFEDLWPFRGDYDFNDMVVEYNFNQITDASNRVVIIDAQLRVKAIGASFANGFGFEIDIAPGLIGDISGQSLKNNYIVTNPNGTEQKQSNAVIICFDNAFDLLPHPGKGLFVNTQQNGVFVEPVTQKIQLNFNAPVSLDSLTRPPYNPFMIVNQNREIEVHLPNKKPTNLADKNIFGTGNDRTNATEGTYYLGENGMPWAIHLPSSFKYPAEKISISNAYNNFNSWANSQGVNFPEWYIDHPGNINHDKVYDQN